MPIEHISDFNEAVAIIEHHSDVEIEHRHLEAVVEVVEAREATILTMRKLLNEVQPYICGSSDSSAAKLKNRVTNTLATTWPEKDLVA